MKHHPIQLMDIQIRELHLTVNNPEECQQPNLEAHIAYKVGSHIFHDENDVLMAGVKCLINEGDENAPFKLRVHLVGIFSVGNEFPKDKIEHFAHHNAPLILMPYVRENVYALAVRSGVRVHLPLVQVPTKNS